MVASQDTDDRFYGVSDLHAMTTTHDPVVLRAAIAEVTTLFLAAGLDPDKAVLFRGSRVLAHRELAYLLDMHGVHRRAGADDPVQGEGPRPPVHAGLALHLPGADGGGHPAVPADAVVPVGDDQRQHVELTREPAVRDSTTPTARYRAGGRHPGRSARG